MAQQPPEDMRRNPEGPRSNATMVFLLGGIVVLALAIGIYYMRGSDDPSVLEPAAGYSQTGMATEGDGINNRAAPAYNNSGANNGANNSATQSGTQQQPQ